jgi:quinol monooxygenase YgiN
VTDESGDIALGHKLVTIAGRGCQVVNTLRRSAPVTISYNGAEIMLDDPSSPRDANHQRSSENTMEKLGILVVLDARPGKEQELEAFLTSALPLAQAEPKTVRWYALKLGPAKFGIFDTFADQAGRDAHLAGEIAKALFAKADELLAKPPAIDQAEILAVKDAVS